MSARQSLTTSTETNGPEANIRKPSWFSKLTKRQVPTTSVTTQTYPDPSRSSSSSHSRLNIASTSPSSNQTQLVQQVKKETIVDSCRCCGTLITYPSDSAKIKCAVCHTVVILDGDLLQRKKHQNLENPRPLSYIELKKIIQDCKLNPCDHCKKFKPLEEYLSVGFRNFSILNNAFRKNGSKNLASNSSGINYEEVRKFYLLLQKLPTPKPYLVLLHSANALLSRPERFSQPDEVYWLLILLEIPSLSSCVILSHKSFSHEINSISYEVLKRVIGLLGYSDKTVKQYLSRWFAKLNEVEFNDKINLINLYITFHLNRCINSEIKRTSNGRKLSNSGVTHLTNDDDAPKETSETVFSSRFWRFGNVIQNQKGMNIKVKLAQYGNDWHLRSAGRLSAILFSSNMHYRLKTLPSSYFYNTMVDYVNVKQDFDAWQYNCESSNRRPSEPTADGEPSLETVVEYLQNITTTNIFGIGSPMSPLSTKMRPTFTFCQYPFLISLGAKISILEYEAKKQMERKAEEAFISSLHKKIPIDVYFRLRVRRNFITHDSLRSILQHPTELKKSLKVEFVNEPGIDAGGLKKEWFMLLSKELFNPSNGLFTYNDESQLGWFSHSSIDNSEMYYLVGVILGLAIYNSTILDLQFPQIFYKKLLGKQTVSLEDYQELYPVSGSNLKKLLHYKRDFDFGNLELYFDVTYKDLFGQVHTAELIPNGSNIKVTYENKVDYIHKYINYLLNELVAGQLKSFKTGFDNVIGGNGLSLFDSEEIELLLVGDASGATGDKFLDVSILRVVTKYQGGLSDDSELVEWFWNYTENLDFQRQKQLLLFISGSDRLPATGVQALNFKMTLLNGPNNRLPIAHTCFNEICVFNYPSKEYFWDKLSIAINESEGFGIK